MNLTEYKEFHVEHDPDGVWLRVAAPNEERGVRVARFESVDALKLFWDTLSLGREVSREQGRQGL